MFVVIEDHTYDRDAKGIKHGVRLASRIIFETRGQAMDYIDYLGYVYGPNGRRIKELV